MGKGGNETEWKQKVDDAYQIWKYNDLHKKIKAHFKDACNKSRVPDALKKEVDETSPILNDLTTLHDIIQTEEAELTEKLFVRDSNENITFLGSNIEVPVSVADDEEVESYCKGTIFSGFWKTVKKLCNAAYSRLKSGCDILKKLFKKIVDFMEAGMQKVVIAIGKTAAKIIAWANPLPKYEEHEILDGIKCIRNLPFENVERTITNVPQFTFFPRTIEEISKVIKHAKEEGKRVRAAGMKHSWTDLFSNNDEYLMYLCPLEATDHLTFSRLGSVSRAKEILKNWDSELNSIEIIEELDDNHASVRVGAATTNLEMLDWAIENGWTLPMNIIAAMITYGGSNATITHGAGINNKNLNDMVLKIEFVNALGELQCVDDPVKLKSVSGAFGLMGIVTHITFRMDRMTYARYHPKKSDMIDSIPRPGGDSCDAAFKKMVDLCQNHYYAEFFWFSNNGVDCGYWENCWKNDGKEEECVQLSEVLDDNYQIASTYLFDVTTLILQPLVFVTKQEQYDDDISLREIVRYIFAKIITKMGHCAMPHQKNPITTSLAEAMHFKTGFHYIMVREMEMQIPIPSLPDGGPDFSIVSKAWWDAIDLIERKKLDNVHVCDMALELRIMGGSDVTLAPQYGNKHGTLSIEPVATRMVGKEVWEDFKDELAKIWMSYRDCDGTLLNTRTHWAKENPRTADVNGHKEEIVRYWQMVYNDRMKEFFDVLDGLTEGVTVLDLNKMFSNRYLDEMFKPQWERFGVNLKTSCLNNLLNRSDSSDGWPYSDSN